MERGSTIDISGQPWMLERLRRCLRLLLVAAKYVEACRCDRCQLAIRMDELREAGIEAIDCRWMMIEGILEHFIETTYPGDYERSFRKGDAIITQRSCFMLTKEGEGLVGHFLYEEPTKTVVMPTGHGGQGDSDSIELIPIPAKQKHKSAIPQWDSQRQELWFRGNLIKQYRIPSPNQVAILSVFEEENWPSRIDDPLPHHHEIDPRRRLNDTIRNLNRSRINGLIRFSGDGSGQGILWEEVT